jgi:uncharacterized protein YecE (DUF72 family)
VPKGFVFAVKASRYITHLKRLKDPDEPVSRLLQHARGLGSRLGPVLFQLPARFRPDLDRLDAFLDTLRRHHGVRFALELRYRGWLRPETFRLLERAGCALCLPVGMGLPVEVRLTADFTYVRMHHGRRGVGFGPRELDLWADRIARLNRDADAYVYFNNDGGAKAIRDAERLRSLLLPERHNDRQV